MCMSLSPSVSLHTSTGPPSRPDKSPQYSASHSHSPPHTTAEHTREHTRETLSSPDATPPTSRKDGRGHPLLPTPIGPPPAMRGVGDSPTQYPLKSPTLAMLPVGGAVPFSVRSPRPPLLSTPPYPTTVPQPHMALFPVWREGWGGAGAGGGGMNSLVVLLYVILTAHHKHKDISLSSTSALAQTDDVSLLPLPSSGACPG